MTRNRLKDITQSTLRQLGFEHDAPYTVVLVKLEEGPLVTAQLTDMDDEDVRIGMPVEMVTRKLRTEGEEGMIVYGYKFRPAVAVTEGATA